MLSPAPAKDREPGTPRSNPDGENEALGDAARAGPLTSLSPRWSGVELGQQESRGAASLLMTCWEDLG